MEVLLKICQYSSKIVRKTQKKNKSVGLVYINDPGWTGGTDYVLNLLNALSYLPNEQRPDIKLFIDESVDSNALKSKIIYPKFKIVQIKKRRFSIQKLIYTLNIVNSLNNKKFDIIYPFPKNSYYQSYFAGVPSIARYYWIPDFQEEYFPMFFSEAELRKRRKTRDLILKNPENKVVFSSRAALCDALKYYPDSKAKTFILHFANPAGLSFDKESSKSILSKYGVEEGEYFISPNQFCKHKNHAILASTMLILKKQGLAKKILLTGREQDSRDPDFFSNLKKSITSMGLEDEIHFLGFLPKQELYTLMAYSKAMIQPSLFEGWSTTIEDAIAMNVPVICSDLDVNREQMGDAAIFFNPNDPNDLALCLINDEKMKRPYFDLDKRVLAFAQSFLALTEEK
jgi:glycosyltransferase involved in cell wall biosynthesis